MGSSASRSRYETGFVTYTAHAQHLAVFVTVVSSDFATTTTTATTATIATAYSYSDFVSVREAKEGSKGKRKRRKIFRRTGDEDEDLG
jgi:hypothetical protein